MFKKLFINILFVSSSVMMLAADRHQPLTDSLTIGTYNVRIQIASDKADRSWSARKKQVAELINRHGFDVFGVQELMSERQEKSLTRLLPAYAHVSKGRNDSEGKTGERLAIYYNKTRFEVLNQGFFFLSETPEKAAKGWDADFNRICLWVELHDKVADKTFWFFNTHLDHKGIRARAESAKLIVSKIKQIARSNNILCVGDFNAPPTETAVYNTMTNYLADSRVTSETPPAGTTGTFNGWDAVSADFGSDVLIDYIYQRDMQVTEYTVINDKSDKRSTYPSDHFPIKIRCVYR
jgi:endonuclease/exonuclease/phosphatase family metal-dependent hydrolase